MLPMTVGLGSIAALAVLVWNSVLALTLTFQNADMDFASSQIKARDVGFGVMPVTLQNGTTINVLRAGFATASMDGLCISKSETILGLQVNLKLTAGNTVLGGVPEIDAANASFDLTTITGGGQTGSAGNGVTLNGTDQIGLATTDLTTLPGFAPYQSNPLGAPATGDPAINGGYTNGQGWTGIDATSGDLYNVKGKLRNAQISGAVRLPGLHIGVTTGTSFTSCQAAPYPK